MEHLTLRVLFLTLHELDYCSFQMGDSTFSSGCDGLAQPLVLRFLGNHYDHSIPYFRNFHTRTCGYIYIYISTQVQVHRYIQDRV